MNTKNYKDKDNKEWICTDPDQYQYCHITSPTIYEYKQKWGFKRGWCRSIIDLADFTEEEIRKQISYFYSSLEELKETYEGGKDVTPNQIIAECIFENTMELLAITGEELWRLSEEKLIQVHNKNMKLFGGENQDRHKVVCKYILRQRELEHMRLSIAYRDRIKEKERKWRMVKRKMGL